MVEVARPTPSTVAARMQGQRMRGSNESIRAAATSNFPHLVWLAQQAGSSVDAEIAAWIDHYGASAVADWLDLSVIGFRLISRWDESRGKHTPLFAALVQEERLSSAAHELGPDFRAMGLTLSESLVEARERVAQSALDAAFAASWKNKTVFSRAIGLARTYLVYLMEKARLEDTEPKRSLLSRFGISTVLAARFAHVRQGELEDACEALQATHDRGADNALSYFIEGCLWRYDLFDDLGALQSAARVIRDGGLGTNKDVNWYLNGAEVWLKLAGESRSLEVRAQCCRNANHALESARLHNPSEADTVLRIAMLEAVERFVAANLATGGANLRGLRFPYCLRTPHVELPDTLRLLAPALIEAISRHRGRGGYIFRDVLAEIHSYLARQDVDGAVLHLKEAIQQRDGNTRSKPLRGDRSQLAQAEDQLLLARLSARSFLRRQALIYLGTPTESPAMNATKLVVMAQDVEVQGPVPGPLLPVDQNLALAARNGEAPLIYEAAAVLAIESHELQRRQLGGRGGVIVLQDAEGSIGQTFVFKKLSALADMADRERTEALIKHIEFHGEGRRFGVVEHLSTIRAAIPGMSTGVADVVSVRRFTQGQTLDEAIAAGPSRAKSLVGQTARFLAMFHADTTPTADGLRRCLWEKEPGRWLRSMFAEDERSEVYAQWWDVVAGAPVFERRDAHALNWLLDTTGRILAVDLDAKGVRPLGYELAQLIEDVPWLAPDDWETRRQLLREYLESLRRYGWTGEVAFPEALQFFGAGVLARALWLFSHPSASSSTRVRAGRLIEGVARELSGTAAGELARRLELRWTEIAGVDSGTQELVLTVPERRRISRAMAFHLRHNPELPATKDGWVHVEELTVLLTNSGHRVTPNTLLLIAGAAGEPRFERDGSDIRAKYGHSVERAIAYETKTPPGALYHATPLENLRSIFEARAGLRRGKRQWVHLSDNPATALNASSRQQKPVALLRVRAANVAGLVYASGSTWLAPNVPSEYLEIVTLQEAEDIVAKVPM